MDTIWQALIDAKLVPPDSHSASTADIEFGANILPDIVKAWRSTSDPANAPLWLNRQKRNAEMTVGFPRQPAVNDWLGLRLIWWPCGRPPQQRLGIVSSRLGRVLERHLNRFAAIRRIAMQIDPANEILITAKSTTADLFIKRCGQLFGAPVLDMQFPENQRVSLKRWARQVTEMLSSVDQHDKCAASEAVAGTGTRSPNRSPAWSPPADYTACFSPPIDGDAKHETNDIGGPIADLGLFACADRLFAIHVTPNGNIHRLLRRRLSDDRFPRGSVFVTLGADAVAPDVAEPLMDSGAVGWYSIDSAIEIENGGGVTSAESQQQWQPQPLPDEEPWPWLTHCTRRRYGPWPEESEDRWIDDLILDRGGADHSAFAALWRIVRTRRLVATADMVRGNKPVVSFTEVPLTELQSLRSFRPHLGRWDFEPYGVCLRKDRLTAASAKSVVYGDEEAWSCLNPGDQPFFQPATSGKYDWRQEREWRHLGDVEMHQIGREDAFVFVPTRDEAEQLAPICPWPVSVLATCD